MAMARFDLNLTSESEGDDDDALQRAEANETEHKKQKKTASTEMFDEDGLELSTRNSNRLHVRRGRDGDKFRADIGGKHLGQFQTAKAAARAVAKFKALRSDAVKGEEVEDADRQRFMIGRIVDATGFGARRRFPIMGGLRRGTTHGSQPRPSRMSSLTSLMHRELQRSSKISMATRT